MKKRFAILAVLLSASLLAAGSNQQKIYPVTDDVYDAIALLSLRQGKTMPSTTAPYSEAELRLMMEELDPGHMSDGEKAVYAYIEKRLGRKPLVEAKYIALDFPIGASFEMYAHPNTEAFTTWDNWVRGYMKQEPLAYAGLEMWPGNNFYGTAVFAIGQTEWNVNTFGSHWWASNGWGLWPNDAGDFDQGTPTRAFLAAGGPWWSFEIGRDRLRWGSGVTGNLTMGDNIQYHNLLRLTTFSSLFKYTFVMSFFPHPQQYINDDGTVDTDEPAVWGAGQEIELDGINMFMAHRFEGRLFDRATFYVTEAIMYQSKENTLDLRIISPLAFYHNYYIRSNANSLVSLEFDWTIIRGLNFYFQAALDQGVGPDESGADDEESGEPNAFGYLGGLKYMWMVGNEGSHAWVDLEAAYTSPYLYLRYATQKSSTADNPDGYQLNFVGVVRQYHVTYGTRYEASWLGYVYGPDAIVVNLNGGWRRFGKWNLEGNLFFMAHGTHDLYTAWSQIGGDSDVPYDLSTPTSTHYTYNYNGDVSGRDAASYTVVFGFHGSYQFTRFWSVYGQVDYVHVNNFGNHSGDTEQDIQFTLGASWKY